MLGFIRRLRPRHLVAAWGAWWLLLLLRLAPAFAAIWRATHAGHGEGNFSLSFGNGVLTLLVTVSGRTLWTGSMSFLALALLVGLPPLAMWLLWVSLRPATSPDRAREPVR
jgi:hypothetical protein